jgi:hypothetical protein
MALGDWDWVEAGGGRLARRDELMLKAQAVQALAMAKLSPKRADTIARIDLETILPPDGAVARAAEALAAEVSEPWLFNHSARAYLWARLLLPDLKFDDEAVYVALMLHDLGLTQAFMDRSGEEVCFTRPAAREAHRLTRSMGWEERRARLVADAIALHLNVVVGSDQGAEAMMVRTGSGADVAGLGLKAVARPLRDAVCGRHPRLELKTRMVEALDAEAARTPCCRIGFMYRSLGFRDRVLGAPFDT